MALPDLALVGAAGPGFDRLAEGLSPARVQVLALEEHAAPAALAAAWAAQLEPAESLCALLVYQAPWRFLERQLAAAPSGRPAAKLAAGARAALESWERHSAALLQLARRLGARAMLVNADRVGDPMRLLQAVQAKLGVRQGWRHGASSADVPCRHEALYRQMVDALAPGSLALYGSLESSAELLGAEPEFQPVAPVGRHALAGEVLKLAAEQMRLESDLAEARSTAQGAKAENALYLVQLEQLEAQLAHFYDQDREKGEQLAALATQLEATRAPLVRRLARRAGGSAAALIAATSAMVSPGGRRLQREKEAVQASGLFDERWYREKYPDVAAAGSDPLEHFLLYGAAEGRNPGPGFDTQWYLEAYPDVTASGANPLVHFVRFGRAEGRQGMPGAEAGAAAMPRPARAGTRRSGERDAGGNPRRPAQS